MPFRKKCRITMENIDNDPMLLYYQVDYITHGSACGCCLFSCPVQTGESLPAKSVVVLLDGVQGRGQYVGTLSGLGRS